MNLFIILLVIQYIIETRSNVVDTESGKLKGAQIHAKYIPHYDYYFYAFKGIPYVEPPIEDLRFKDPVPKKKWTGVNLATEYGPSCPQASNIKKSEDCLYLNVYTKNVNTTELRPVMFWITGGAFRSGLSSDFLYGPEYLLRKEVIIVTVNYRIGVLGWLNLEDKVATGNQGLKDLILALKWVKTNIKNFGGDPERVTIFGESAGGSLVHHLTLSASAKGLFHQAIAQSGLAISPSAMDDTPKKSAVKLSKYLGFQSENPQDIYNFLKKVTVEDLIKGQGATSERMDELRSIFHFTPSRDNLSQTPVIPDDIHEVAKSGVSVPLLYGHNDADGSLILPKFHEYSDINKDLSKYINMHEQIYLFKSKITVADFRYYYYGKKSINWFNRGRFSKLLTDLYFVNQEQLVAKYQLNNNFKKTYLYRFQYDKAPHFGKIFSLVPGAAHADDLGYLWAYKSPSRPNPVKWSKQSYKIMEQMVEMWTNFAIKGNPTPGDSEVIKTSWETITDADNLNYMIIDKVLQPTIVKSNLVKYTESKKSKTFTEFHQGMTV